MKYIINDAVVLSRAPEGPLVVWLDRFASFTSSKGYARSSIHRQVLLAAGFSQWLKQEGIEPEGITSDHPTQYFRCRTRQFRPRQGDSAALKHVIDFLRVEGVIPVENMLAHRVTEAERCVQAYERYLRETRGLAATTIKYYVPFTRNFLWYCFGSGPVALSQMSASDVVGFVQRKASLMSRRRAKLMTTALRSFLRYLRYHVAGMPDLAAAVPVVANWSATSMPRAISADQVHRLLTSVGRDTAMGRRDYAILLLLARLGLRSSEVAFLELDDIDWNTGTLRVRAKGGMRNELPLSREIGEAFAAYLSHGRPLSASRRVFLRAKAPIRGFRGPSGIGSVVRHALQRAGMEAPSFGTHQFRHGLATGMLRQGASLGEIGDVLGHRHPDTTRIYTRVDLAALRTLALPWPGGVR